MPVYARTGAPSGSDKTPGQFINCLGRHRRGESAQPGRLCPRRNPKPPSQAAPLRLGQKEMPVRGGEGARALILPRLDPHIGDAAAAAGDNGAGEGVARAPSP